MSDRTAGQSEGWVRFSKGEMRGSGGFVVRAERATRPWDAGRHMWFLVFTDWMPPFRPLWYRDDEVEVGGRDGL